MKKEELKQQIIDDINKWFFVTKQLGAHIPSDTKNGNLKYCLDFLNKTCVFKPMCNNRIIPDYIQGLLEDEIPIIAEVLARKVMEGVENGTVQERS